jgi:UDP-N-acetyl-D-mannosaminuronate dehydrogenase
MRVCILGLTDCDNYGERLACRAASKGHKVYAYDDDIQFVVEKQKGDDPNIKFMYAFGCVPLCQIYVVTVTPDRVKEVVDMLNREVGDPINRTVVVESELPVGRTRPTCSILLNKGFKVCYSPRFHNDSTSKLIAGEGIGDLEQFYTSLFNKVEIASSIEVAEASRLLVGLFRATNVTLANEFSELCKNLDLDPFEVIDMASQSESKRFMPFSPWVGIGGAASEDPFKTLMVSNTPLIKAVSNHVISRPRALIDRLPEELSIDGPFLVIGVGYKAYSSAWETSPVSEFINNLSSKNVNYWDPYVGKSFPDAEWIELEDAASPSAHWEAVFVFHPYMLSTWKKLSCNNKFFYCQTEAFI